MTSSQYAYFSHPLLCSISNKKYHLSTPAMQNIFFLLQSVVDLVIVLHRLKKHLLHFFHY